MTYNTGNPIGSADARDLYDNAQNLDKAMNSTDPTWIDRFGVSRPTFKGAESELNQKVGDAEAAATEARGYLNTMRATSYGPLADDPATDPLGNPCTAGDEYFNTTYNLLKRFDGSIWRVPDINTENLASGAGSSMVGHGGQTVEAALNERLPEIGNYAGLDAYNGDATAVLVYGVANIFDGGAGVFRRTTDTPAAANGIYRQDALGRWWKREFSDVIHAAWFGVVANGADATAAAVAAVAAANALVRPSYFSSIYTPGATLVFPPGEINFATLSAPMQLLCNLRAADSAFLIPASYDKEVVQIGYTSGLRFLSGADISLPDIYKPLSSSIIAGSVGYRVYNTSDSKIRAKKTWYFETCAWFGGVGAGCEHNEILLGQMFYCKRAIVLEPGAGGWANANTFVRGDIQQSPGYFGGSRLAGYRHVRLDGRAGTPVVGNVFIGTSIQGDASEYMIDCQQAYKNTFIAPYIETGFVSIAASVSGDTITSVGHPLVVGDLVAFQATSLPGGMVSPAPYFVVFVSGDTFKVSTDKGGTAITFSSSGSGVTWVRSPRFLFAQAGNEACFDNGIENALYVPSTYLDIVETGQARNNGTGDRHVESRRVYEQESIPLWRGVNDYSGNALSHPIFAGYPSGTKPYEKPNFWNVALTSLGLAFSSAGSRLGEITNSSGALSYKRPADTATYEIASCRRSPSLISITSLSVPANSQASTSITLTGASVNDHVVITPTSAMTAGISIAYAYVSAANTITVVFGNSTGSPISLTTQVNAMAVRRFY